MEKKILTVLSAFLIFTTAFAQKELWGYKVVYSGNPEFPGPEDGQIIKVPLEGINSAPEVVHTFDVNAVGQRFPRGRLLQASNGKLYGTTASYIKDNFEQVNGVLFEYDPVLDQYQVLSNSLAGQQENEFGVIEPLPGILYGTTNNGNSIFKYVIATHTFSIAASIPPFINLTSYHPKFIGELMKASDGNLYGLTDIAPSGAQNNVNYVGGLYRFNMETNQITKMYVFGYNDGSLNVYYPIYGSKLIEGAPGKLYGTAYGGDHIGPQGIAPLGSGTLFEYTIATNTVAKKFDFDYNVNGANPSVLTKGPGNKLYGTLVTAADQSYPTWAGAIFEYDTASSALNIIHAMDPIVDQASNLFQEPGLFASDSSLFVPTHIGILKYTFETDSIERKVVGTYSNDIKPFIEICRKPAYHFFDTASFTICIGEPFSFDVQNTNATGYTWKKNGDVLPGQTTGILTFTSVVPNDTGIYTCEMVNECGTTITMPLQLTADECLGLDEAIGFKNAIRLYPNPAQTALTINWPESQKFSIDQISISNMLGQRVYNSPGSDTSIDVSALPKGIYILEMKTDKGDWNGKFLKE